MNYKSEFDSNDSDINQALETVTSNITCKTIGPAITITPEAITVDLAATSESRMLAPPSKPDEWEAYTPHTFRVCEGEFRDSLDATWHVIYQKQTERQLLPQQYHERWMGTRNTDGRSIWFSAEGLPVYDMDTDVPLVEFVSYLPHYRPGAKDMVPGCRREVPTEVEWEALKASIKDTREILIRQYAKAKRVEDEARQAAVSERISNAARSAKEQAEMEFVSDGAYHDAYETARRAAIREAQEQTKVDMEPLLRGMAEIRMLAPVLETVPLGRRARVAIGKLIKNLMHEGGN